MSRRADMLNIPNILTIFRILLIPLFLFYLLSEDPRDRLIALIIFCIASITDFFDGYLARRLQQESPLGKFLDPFADKTLVVATLIIFLFLDKLIPLWMVLTIILRDMLVTLIRFLAIRKGIDVRTTKLAKTKTTFQMLAIILILMIFIVRSFHFDIQRTYDEGRQAGKRHFQIASEILVKGFSMIKDKEISAREKRKQFAESVPYFLILFTTWITIFSGLRYLYTNWRVLLPPYHLFTARRE